MILSTLDKSRKGGAYEQIPSLVLGQRWTPQLNSRNMMKVVLCVWIEPYIENDLSFCVWPVHTPTTSKEVLTLSASTSPLPYTGNKSCIVNTLYILGDVIDRNPDGIRILQQLRAMPNVVMLLGNHEYMMLDALYNIPDEEDGYADYLREKRLNLWYRNGGDVTHRYLKHIRKSVRQEILEYLDKLPVNIEIMVNGQKYLLTHAAPEDEYLNSSMKHRDGREFAVWHRYRSHDRGPDDYTVIFGHTPTTEHQLAKPATIWNGRNLIDIDCGAAYEEIDVWGIVIKTRLACLRLDDMKEFYSEEDLNEEGNQRR